MDGPWALLRLEALDASIAQRIADYHAAGNDVVLYADTHGTNYAQTQEGRNCSVPTASLERQDGSLLAPPPPPWD